MTALYRLGTGASFRICRALCHISTSEVQLFFDTFLQGMHEMREEFISMPTNITQLRRISKYYDDAGLPGCCGLMDVVHVKWSQSKVILRYGIFSICGGHKRSLEVIKIQFDFILGISITN